jgi:hypothetical protein
MADATRSAMTFELGQAVLLRIGRNELAAKVLEDRGPIGADGGHVIRVSVDLGEGVDRADFEVPESALRAAA